MKKYFPSKRTF